jgi:integrase/recombinase XerC
MTREAPEPWGPLIHEWARALHAENKAARTIEGYTDTATRFHLWHAARPDAPGDPTEVTTRHVRDWIGYRLDATSAGNANNNYRALQRWFAFLLEEGEIDVHPMRSMKPPHVPEKLVPVISEELIKKVLAGCAGRDLLSRRDTALIRLLWDTGARLSEVGMLTVADVDLTLDVIRVTGKGGKQRAIPFSAKTGQALSRYLRVPAQDRWGRS